MSATAKSREIRAEKPGVEKRLVMVSVKRMISVGLAAVLALALSWSPLTYAQTSNAADVREKPRQGGAQAAPQTRNSRDAKRPPPYAKRSGETPRSPRMSPEERRQLRRDIKDAGREIYPPRR